jgi:hypothetical protein
VEFGRIGCEVDGLRFGYCRHVCKRVLCYGCGVHVPKYCTGRMSLAINRRLIEWISDTVLPRIASGSILM